MKKYIYALKAYAKYKYLTVVNEKVVTGATARITGWDDDEDSFMYVSFSKDPVDGYFDDFGVADDEVFHYFDGIREVVHTILAGNEDGWRITEIDYYTL